MFLFSPPSYSPLTSFFLFLFILPHFCLSSSSNGRACQVNGDNSLEWKKFRLNRPIRTGDVLGCGWVLAEGEEGTNTGTVYFTHNGDKCGNEFSDVPGEMLPFVHIQKKVI